jgi:ATP-binding cassette, subfamily C, bacterial
MAFGLSSFANDANAFRSLAKLLTSAPRKRLTALLSLMVLNAFTEGFGIMLLVPIVSIAGQLGSVPSAWGSLLGALGLTNSLGALLCVFVALITMRSVLQFVLQQLKLSLEIGVVDGLRAEGFSGLMNAEWRWIAQGRGSDFSALMITNIARIGSGLTSALELIASSCVAIAYLASAMLLSWQAAFVVLIGGAAVVTAFSGLRRKVTSLGHNFSMANKAMHQQVQEGVSAVRLTKLTGNEEQQAIAYRDVMQSVRWQQRAYSSQSARAQAALQIGGATVLSVMVYVGLQLTHIPFPVLLPLLLVSMRLVPLFGSLQQSWNNWLHAVPAFGEIEKLLADLKKNAEPVTQNLKPIELIKAIKIRDLSLLYGGRTEPALTAVSLEIPAFKTTAIIGASGAGKSSLADILTGLIEADQGTFCVDGVPITSIMRKRWRHSVSYVQQDAFLFHTSVRANLLWSHPEASEADLHKVLAMASADFVHALPEGLDTIVGDGGVRLSGGERQRIALARALLRAPALLILDEATSALDPANETAIRNAIAKLHGNLTILLIGHRLAMLDQADQVIELSKGRVLKQGSWNKAKETIESAA